MAGDIEAPPGDIARGFVQPNRVGEEPVVRTRSGPDRPDDAFCAVQRRGHLSWIDRDDWRSKGSFSFLTMMFQLKAGAREGGGPVLRGSGGLVRRWSLDQLVCAGPIFPIAPLTPLPDPDSENVFSSIISVDIANELVIFHAVDLDLVEGLFFWRNGDTNPILKFGDELDGKTIQFLNLIPQSRDGATTALKIDFTDGSDALYLAELVLPCTGDLTGDGVVDPDDLFLLLGAWGPCAGCPEDLTGDGIVDPDDLFQLLGAWGPCP
jgi:hypothetical protein